MKFHERNCPTLRSGQGREEEPGLAGQRAQFSEHLTRLEMVPPSRGVNVKHAEQPCPDGAQKLGRGSIVC